MTKTPTAVEKLDRPEHSGDWHDKPLKWIVKGPGAEIQKFSTKKWALQYASCRRNSANGIEAHRKFAALD